MDLSLQAALMLLEWALHDVEHGSSLEAAARQERNNRVRAKRNNPTQAKTDTMERDSGTLGHQQHQVAA